MKLSIRGKELNLKMEGFEKLWSMKSGFDITIEDIESVSPEKPQDCPSLRAPGTYFPGLIKAGTYYTREGKEFWYHTKGKSFLTIGLKGGKYKRLVLGLDETDRDYWKSEIEKLL